MADIEDNEEYLLEIEHYHHVKMDNFEKGWIKRKSTVTRDDPDFGKLKFDFAGKFRDTVPMSKPTDPSESPKPLTAGVPLYGENLAILLELSQILGDITGHSGFPYGVDTGDAYVPNAGYGSVHDFDRILRKRLKAANPSVEGTMVDDAVTRSASAYGGMDHFVATRPRRGGELAAVSYWHLGAILETLIPSEDELSMKGYSSPDYSDYMSPRSAYFAQSAFPSFGGSWYSAAYEYENIIENEDSTDPEYPEKYETTYDENEKRAYDDATYWLEQRARSPGSYGQAVARHAASSSFSYLSDVIGSLYALTVVRDPSAVHDPYGTVPVEEEPHIAMPCAPNVSHVSVAIDDFRSLSRVYFGAGVFSVSVVGPHRFVRRWRSAGYPEYRVFSRTGSIYPGMDLTEGESRYGGDRGLYEYRYVEAGDIPDGEEGKTIEVTPDPGHAGDDLTETDPDAGETDRSPHEDETFLCGILDLGHPWISKWLSVVGFSQTVAVRTYGDGSFESFGTTEAYDPKRLFYNRSNSYKYLDGWWLKTIKWTYVGQCDDRNVPNPAAVADPNGPGRYAVFSCRMADVAPDAFFSGLPVGVSDCRSKTVTAKDQTYSEWEAHLVVGPRGYDTAYYYYIHDAGCELSFRVRV